MRAMAPRENFGLILLMVFAITLALFLGAIAAIGNVLIALVLGGAFVGLFMMMRPDLMLWMMAMIVLVLSGLLQTFADIHQLQWGASILGVGLIVRAMLDRITMNPERFRRAVGTQSNEPTNYIAIFAVLFITVLIFGTIASNPSLPQLIVGFRIYAPFWGVFLILSFGNFDPKLMQRLVISFFFIAILQAPVTIFQKLVIVPQRIEGRYFGSAWDSIVGTFGGGKFGGGASGSMAVFLVCMCLIAASLWKDKLLKTSSFGVVFLASMIAMGLAEAKVIFIILPLGLIFLFKDQLFKNPLRFVSGFLATGAVLAGILYSYFKFYWESETRGDVYEAVLRRFAYSFDPNFWASADWPGRFTGLFIWSKNHNIILEPDTTLLGHGVAAATSFSTLMGPSREALRFGMGLEVSGATKLLWDSGALGFLFFISMFISAFFLALRAARRPITLQWHRSVLRGIAASMPLLVLVLFYEVTTVSSPSLQFLSMFFFGYIVFWLRKSSNTNEY